MKKRPNRKGSPHNPNQKSLKKSLKKLEGDLKSAPGRLSKSISEELSSSMSNVNNIARINLRDLNKELENVLKQEIEKSNKLAKRQLRKSNEKIRKKGSKLRSKISK